MGGLGIGKGPLMPDTAARRRLAGRYRLDRPLGHGGMGELWAGEDLRLARPVAVKLLRADLARLDEPRRRFEVEARAAAQLVHPNVVAVFDTGEDDGTPFIVMELLSGLSLRDVLDRGPLSPTEARSLADQVLAALAVAHAAGIVHRDIKPGNVLRGSPEGWKLADFGIAKSLEAASDLTRSGLVPGTLAYVAPERLDGKPATPGSDLYSVGVMLYEAVAGRRPFHGDNPLATMHAIRTTAAPPLDEVRPGLDAELVRTLRGAMQRDPSRRFPDAEAMRAALARATVATGTGGPDTEPVRPPARRERNHPTATSILPRVPSRTRSPRRSRAALAIGAAAAIVAAVVLAASLEGGGASSPSHAPSSTPTRAPATAGVPPAASLPAPLAGALRRLDSQVRP